VTTNCPPEPVFLRNTPVVAPPPVTLTSFSVMFAVTPSMLMARPVVEETMLPGPVAPLIVSEPAPTVLLVALIPVPLVVSMSSEPSEKVTLAPAAPVLVKVMGGERARVQRDVAAEVDIAARIVDDADSAPRCWTRWRP
jgi:hypothetical protein